jgi:hypothetical protein
MPCLSSPGGAVPSSLAGVVDFERSMAKFSEKADRADIAWQRFVAGCHLDVTKCEPERGPSLAAGDGSLPFG